MAETFNATPQYVWEFASAHNVLETTFETGKTQRRYKGAKPRQWNLTFRGTWSTISGVVDFFNARKGSFESFSWTPPGEDTSITAVFLDNSLSITRHGLSSLSECSLAIKEVLT